MLSEQKLIQFSGWIEKNDFLFAVKRTAQKLLPVLMLGFFGAAIEKTSTNLLESLGTVLVAVTLLPIALYAVLGVAYYYGQKIKILSAELFINSVLSFLLMAVTINHQQVVKIVCGPKDFIPAVILSGSVVWLTKLILKKIAKINNEHSRQLVRQFLPTLVIVFLSLLLRVIFIKVTGQLPIEQFANIFHHILHLFDFWWVIFLVLVVRAYFWSYGVHASVWDFILRPVGLVMVGENILAWRQNLALPHLMSYSALSAFGNFTGTGVTIGLVIALALSKAVSKKELAKVAFKPALMGINEMILFGLPVVNNKKMRIPFIIGGSFLGVVPFIWMQYGGLNRPLLAVPAVPIFVEGLLVTGDLRSVFVQLGQIVLSVIFYGVVLKIGGESHESI